MNPELCRQALAKVVNPNVLVNLVSRRVRQLNAGGGGSSRPLVGGAENMGAADIALKEIVEGKMGWEMPDFNILVAETKPKKRRKS
jgi:DNA-directed RNA polymerase subunit omega